MIANDKNVEAINQERNDMHAEMQQMVLDCQNRESKLSKWEVSFIQSIGEQLDAGHFLSQKQEDCLNKVWDKVTV